MSVRTHKTADKYCIKPFEHMKPWLVSNNWNITLKHQTFRSVDCTLKREKKITVCEHLTSPHPHSNCLDVTFKGSSIKVILILIQSFTITRSFYLLKNTNLQQTNHALRTSQAANYYLSFFATPTSAVQLCHSQPPKNVQVQGPVT